MREGQQRRKHGVKGAAATSWPLLCIRAAWVPWPLRVWEPDLKPRRGLRWGSRGHLIHPSGWVSTAQCHISSLGRGAVPSQEAEQTAQDLADCLSAGHPRPPLS